MMLGKMFRMNHSLASTLPSGTATLTALRIHGQHTLGDGHRSCRGDEWRATGTHRSRPDRLEARRVPMLADY